MLYASAAGLTRYSFFVFGVFVCFIVLFSYLLLLSFLLIYFVFIVFVFICYLCCIHTLYEEFTRLVWDQAGSDYLNLHLHSLNYLEHIHITYAMLRHFRELCALLQYLLTFGENSPANNNTMAQIIIIITITLRTIILSLLLLLLLHLLI